MKSKMAEQMLSNALQNVVQEIRIQSLTKHVRTFHGEGTTKFTNWLQDMDQVSTTCDSERMCVLATLTLGGTAGILVSRMIKEDATISWETLRKKLRERYGDDDIRWALEKLRHMKQKKGEAVQNFAERLRAAGRDAFQNPVSEEAQKEMVDIFQRGLQDDQLVRRLIRKRFNKFDEAVDYAADEQRTDRTFDLHRHKDETEPMEINLVRAEGELTDLKKTVQELERKLEKATKAKPNNTPRYRPAPMAPRQPSHGYSQPAVPPPFNQPPPSCPPVAAAQPGNMPTRPAGFGPHSNPPAHSLYQWTSDGRPICALCGRIGHIRRRCRGQVN